MVAVGGRGVLVGGSGVPVGGSGVLAGGGVPVVEITGAGMVPVGTSPWAGAQAALKALTQRSRINRNKDAYG